MIIILDVETIGFKYNEIYDIAWALVERNKIIARKNYIVQEHLAHMAEGNFSKPKMAMTMQEVANGRAIIKPASEILAELAEDVANAKYVYAYNATFDRSKVINLGKALQVPEAVEFFSQSAVFDKWRCLMAWSSHTIIYKKSFIDFCEAHDLKTPKGYCSTTAETVLKFLWNKPDYCESHTALRDVEDEFEIYLAIKKQIKKEYSEICLDEENQNFKGKPFFTIAKLKAALES